MVVRTDASGRIVQIGVLGATGPAGRGLPARLAANGNEVVLGSREEQRAAEAVRGLHERWPDHALSLTATTNDGAAAAARQDVAGDHDQEER